MKDLLRGLQSRDRKEAIYNSESSFLIHNEEIQFFPKLAKTESIDAKRHPDRSPP